MIKHILFSDNVFDQLLESLTSIAGVEEDAVKAWVEEGAVTGLEKDAVNVDLLQNLREVMDQMGVLTQISHCGSFK